MGWVLEGQGQVQPQRGLVDGTGSGQAIRSSLDLAQAAWVQQRVDSNPFSQKYCLRSKVAPASPGSSRHLREQPCSILSFLPPHDGPDTEQGPGKTHGAYGSVVGPLHNRVPTTHNAPNFPQISREPSSNSFPTSASQGSNIPAIF